MRVWTPTEVLGCQAGVTLECVAGAVTQVGDQKTGTNNYGPWSIQNVTIADGTSRIKLKLMNQGELAKEASGHKLYVIAGTGKKGQFIGLSTELDTYKGQTSLIVKANENASLSWSPPAGGTEAAGPATTQAPAPPPPTQQAPPPPPPPTQTTQAPPPPPPAQNAPPSIAPPADPAHAAAPPANPGNPGDVKRAWQKVDKGLNKLRRLRLRTLTAALAIQRDASQLGYQMTSDHVEKIDTWLAIECCRNGLLVDVPEMDPPGVTHTPDTGNAGV